MQLNKCTCQNLPSHDLWTRLLDAEGITYIEFKALHCEIDVFLVDYINISSRLQVSSILQKAETDRTDEENEMLFSCSELVKEVTRR
jgi:hypothetical protein